jgi:hypothetical protein
MTLYSDLKIDFSIMDISQQIIDDPRIH